MKLGKVERHIYSLREESPLVIPQIDPQTLGSDQISKICKGIQDCGISHIAIGGSIVNPDKLQTCVDIATKDFDLSSVIYLTNSSSGLVKGKSGKTAVYWSTVLNAENMFFLRDLLVMSSNSIRENGVEPIPTAYVFDDRGDMKTANWLTRATPVPRDKPDISLAIGLAAEYLGIRFYIMAGGSGANQIPPKNHVKLLSDKTELFIIPTSGIKSVNHATEIFASGADAIHVGKLTELPKGMAIIKKMNSASKKFGGKKFG